MKMKIKSILVFLKSSFLSFIIGLTFISCCLAFEGCQNEDLNTSINLPYLSLPTGINYSKLSEADYIIIGHAIDRLEITRDGLFYKIKQTSGKEINISNELFEFIENTVSHTNNLFYKNRSKLSPIRFKSSSEVTPVSPNDCVARALAYYGCADYVTANSEINTTFGNNGVPIDYFYDVCNFFCAGTNVSPSNISEGSMGNMIIVINDGSSSGHAVNGKYCYNGGVIQYWDPQNNCMGYTTIDNVTHCFVKN